MTSRPQIRAAVREDVPAIVALFRDDDLGRTREGEPDDPVYAAAFDAVSANPDTHLYVLERDARVIGCAQLTVIPGLTRRGLTRGLIEGVRVAGSERNQGLGQLIMQEMIRLAREFECGMVQLTSDKSRRDAHRFYETLGFERSHEGFKLLLK